MAGTTDLDLSAREDDPGSDPAASSALNRRSFTEIQEDQRRQRAAERRSRIAKNTGHSEETVPDCFVAARARATGITH